ncbi:MAG: hypothetical protein J0L61_12390, partial [Planctomycetes bacterium]|nr:hypothetical protein [Planctomycetota bacterium]
TYVVPVFGVVLGGLALHEQIDLPAIAAAALILSGIAVINLGGAGMISGPGFDNFAAGEDQNRPA